MRYIAIFSYEEGDFLRTEADKLMLFESSGLALQYIREHFQLETQESKTRRFQDSGPYFVAPFRLQKVVA